MIYYGFEIIKIWRHQTTRVKLICHCGQEFEVDLQNLKGGYVKSCGCTRYLHKFNDLENYFNAYMKDAKRVGRSFNITIDFFELNTKLPCTYCGKFSDESEMMGIDRYDNSIGYEPENCVPCCTICNRMKLDFSIKEWNMWLKNLIYGNKNFININNQESIVFNNFYIHENVLQNTLDIFGNLIKISFLN